MSCLDAYLPEACIFLSSRCLSCYCIRAARIKNQTSIVVRFVINRRDETFMGSGNIRRQMQSLS